MHRIPSQAEAIRLLVDEGLAHPESASARFNPVRK